MNAKTIIVLVVVALIIVFSLKALWKHLKGESGCGCSGGSCCGGSHHDHGAGGCSCKK